MMWLTRLMPYAISALVGLVGLAGAGVVGVNVIEQPRPAAPPAIAQ